MALINENYLPMVNIIKIIFIRSARVLKFLNLLFELKDQLFTFMISKASISAPRA